MLTLSLKDASLLTNAVGATNLPTETRMKLLKNASDDAKAIGSYLIHGEGEGHLDPKLREAAERLRPYLLTAEG
jgi:hypothetical protein